MLDTNQTVEDSQRRARGWIILGVLLLGLLFFLCTCRDSRLIQADLWAKGRAALEFKGYDPNILSMNGRDATLTGTVPTEAIKADAEAVIRSINGIRQVAFQNNLAVGDVPAVAEADTAPTPNLVPLRGPSLNMSIAAGTVTLSGLVAGGSRPQIIEAATELYGEGNVIDNLEVADDVEQPSWLAGALGLLPQVKNEVQEGTLTATSDGITLSGTAASEQAKAGLAAAASSATGLEVNNKLVVATLELKPATFALRLNNGKAELSGTVPEATIAGAVEAASRAVGAENVVNNLQAAADIAAPSWSVGLFGALPSLVKVAPDLGINVVDKTLTLTGTVPSPQMRESLAKQVQDAVGAEVTVANQLQVAEQTPPQLRVKFTPDAVQLSGTVSQSTADSALQMAGTLSGSVVNQMTVAENVAQPAWLPGLLEQLPTFAKGVQEGEVVLQGSTITLVGAVVSEEQKTAVETSIRQAVGADPTITNQLRVVAPVVEVQPALNLKLADNALTLSGNVAQATAEQMMEAVTNLPDTTLTNQLTTADNVAQPEWLPDIIGLVPTYTITVQNAELDLKDNQITLAGVVASEAEKTEMGTQFTNAVGEGAQVINNLQVEAAEPAQVRVTVENGVATLAGNLPEDTASSIASSLAETPDTTVTNEIIAGSSVSMPTWLESVLELLPDMTTEVSNADVNIEGNTITLAGTVPSEEKKTELADELTQAAGAEVEVVNNLTVEEVAPPEPVQLRVQIQDGVTTVTGNVPEATATQVIEAAEATLETASVTNEIEAAPNVQVPPWLPSVVEVLPEAIQDIVDADVSIVADTITLAGVAPNEERKTEIAEMVKQAAGPDVNIVNNIEVDEEPLAETPVAEAIETETPQAETPPAETASTDTAQPEPQTPEAETAAQSETSTPTEQASQAETPQADASSVQEDAPVAEVPSDASEIETPPAETSQAATPESATPQAEASSTQEEPAATVGESEQAETSQAATPTTEPTPQQEETPEPVVVTPTPTRNPEVRIEIVGNTIRLTGTVPSEESVALAAAPYSKETVENLLTATSDVANATWLPKLYEIAPQVASDLNRATLVLSDTTLTIQGTAPSVEQRDAIGKYVNDAFQGELTVINRLTVQEPLPVTEDGK
jgi:osmotically-inducible protein OsmY